MATDGDDPGSGEASDEELGDGRGPVTSESKAGPATYMMRPTMTTAAAATAPASFICLRCKDARASASTARRSFTVRRRASFKPRMT